MLELDGVRTGYSEIEVLTGVDIEVDRGEIVALIGSNGAGKTTTTRAICGMLPVWEGTITFQGEDITGLESHQVVERGILQVPENRHLFTDLSVHENLLLGAQVDRAKEQRKENLERMFDLFPRLDERRSQLAGTMSGGEQQMLTIARALMGEPELLILDEPSIGLAPQLVTEMFAAIERIKEERGLTILAIEQNVHEILDLASRGYVMENGTITIEGPSDELLDDERVIEAYLGIT